jgi:predicted nucleic-acid-binding protein
LASVDTNVLIRLLTADDAIQSAQARTLTERFADAGDCLYVPLTVILELEWVLRSRYEFEKARILATLSALLETRDFDFQDEPALENALSYYKRHRVDFAECLHLGCAASAGKLPLMTFDRVASRIGGTKLVDASA